MKDHVKIFSRTIKDYYSKNNFYTEDEFRKPSGLEYKNKPSIILVGCSYTWGCNLDEKFLLNAQLSEYINAPV
jgi:hypothetical protein